MNDGTEIMRCKIPISKMNGKLFQDPNNDFEFLLTQKWQQFLQYDNDKSQSQSQSQSRRSLLENDDEEKKLVHSKLSFNIGTRSSVPLLTKEEPLLVSDLVDKDSKMKKSRYLSLCMPPMSEPLPFVAENVAHHLAMGVEHIYIGTQFAWNIKEQYTQELSLYCILYIVYCTTIHKYV